MCRLKEKLYRPPDLPAESQSENALRHRGRDRGSELVQQQAEVFGRGKASPSNEVPFFRPQSHTQASRFPPRVPGVPDESYAVQQSLDLRLRRPQLQEMAPLEINPSEYQNSLLPF
ncbi:hypothetical protein CDAR_78161 [Caerostris darwini]|uniref:Uncharacterized protein n=1 Tax=Caerostris darwini TaxID=1538125 RepID=A0AAV4SE72_9ARAC|nr:hypothetical protein CDAR_78161 [Caerostris darwini]